MVSLRALASALLLVAVGPVVGAGEALTTIAEKSSFQRTGRFDEVIALCRQFQADWPEAVRCTEFGRTPEGRPMLALVVSNSGVLDAAQARKRELPVTLIQGGIHAGEIDGKDAGFLAVRELLQGRASSGTLENQVLVFVPVFNIDGHERFGRWNRPNQRGPEQMGWRTTAQNLNLNRDYAKSESPEMQAMLALVHEWDPLAVIDLHVTDGAQFEHDISIQVEPLHSGDGQLRQIGAQFRDAVMADLTAGGSLPLSVYPSFVVTDDPTSGIADGVAPPRFSTGYFPLRNRFCMLVETHSWKDYPTRVRITRNTVVSVLEQIARHGHAWRRSALAADVRMAALAGTPVPLEFTASQKSRNFDFRGYAYTRTPSEVSGALMTRYDESSPQIWKMPIRYDVQPSLVIQAPTGGYLVPPAHAALVTPVLRRHGLQFSTVTRALPSLAAEGFRATTTSFAAQSVEGHQRLALEGQWIAAHYPVGAGSIYVPIAQPRALLVMALLEPRASDSLLAWGYFNNAFEQKEYMEDYVAEQVAREQLAADPALAAEFARKIAQDKAFAGDPQARLQFFARRHASWDTRFNLYPVLRLSAAPR